MHVLRIKMKYMHVKNGLIYKRVRFLGNFAKIKKKNYLIFVYLRYYGMV